MEEELLGNPEECEPSSGIRKEKAEACQLYIEQEVKDLLAQGMEPAEIGRQLSEWVKKLFEANIQPRTLEQRARRQAKSATSVARGAEKERRTCNPNLSPIIEEAEAKIKALSLSFQQREVQKAIDYVVGQGASTLKDIIVLSLQYLGLSLKHAGTIAGIMLEEELSEVEPPRPIEQVRITDGPISILTEIKRSDPNWRATFHRVHDWMVGEMTLQIRGIKRKPFKTVEAVASP